MSLANDYVSLSKEAGRRQADVRDSAEKAANLIKSNQPHAFADLATGEQSTDGCRWSVFARLNADGRVHSPGSPHCPSPPQQPDNSIDNCCRCIRLARTLSANIPGVRNKE